MTIASEILKLNTNLQNSYTAISSKGGTLPAHQNFDNLSTAISSIPGSSSKYTLLQRIKDDNNVNVGNFFLVACTVVGLLLLLIPLFTLTIEAWFNHTITTDLNGMAAYIIAVCSIFTVGGLTHGWTSWAKSKFESINKDSDGNELNDSIKPKTEEELNEENIEEN